MFWTSPGQSILRRFFADGTQTIDRAKVEAGETAQKGKEFAEEKKGPQRKAVARNGKQWPHQKARRRSRRRLRRRLQLLRIPSQRRWELGTNPGMQRNNARLHLNFSRLQHAHAYKKRRRGGVQRIWRRRRSCARPRWSRLHHSLQQQHKRTPPALVCVQLLACLTTPYSVRAPGAPLPNPPPPREPGIHHHQIAPSLPNPALPTTTLARTACGGGREGER
jgi:hypothetical protein